MRTFYTDVFQKNIYYQEPSQLLHCGIADYIGSSVASRSHLIVCMISSEREHIEKFYSQMIWCTNFVTNHGFSLQSRHGFRWRCIWNIVRVTKLYLQLSTDILRSWSQNLMPMCCCIFSVINAMHETNIFLNNTHQQRNEECWGFPLKELPWNFSGSLIPRYHFPKLRHLSGI